MVTVTHFVKTDSTVRTSTATTAAEITQYTITWANLTGAGFANADEVLILVIAKPWGDNASENPNFQVGIGSTYAGRTDDTTSHNQTESVLTTASVQYMWFRKKTLATNDNIYFSRWAPQAGTRSCDDFVCMVIKLADLGASNYGYAETTWAANTNHPTAYDTSGPSFATPAAGDWLNFCTVQFIIDTSGSTDTMAISAGGSDYSELRTTGPDATDENVLGTMAYRAGLGSGQTIRARYAVTNDANLNDITYAAVFGLRLDAFAAHWGAHTTSTITHSVIDTFQEFAHNDAFSIPDPNTPLVVFGEAIHTSTELTKGAYGRIQLADADWPAASANRQPVASTSEGSPWDTVTPILFSYGTITASGAINLDLDIAEDYDITPNYACNTQIAAAFSLFLASTATPITLTSSGYASLFAYGTVPIICPHGF